MALLSGTTDYSGFRQCDVVLEAVFEELALKQRMVEEIESYGASDAVFASNTSSLPISDIAARAQRPQQVIGLHYFSPVDKMPLVEVIPHALMSINAVKGVEIGDGFDVIALRGSENRDEITRQGFQSNHAGGILGGISSGQQIIASIALKPTSSITVPGRTVTRDGEETEMITRGRHDPCVGIRAVPIAEAMLAIVLMDHLLRQRGQNGEPLSHLTGQ